MKSLPLINGAFFVSSSFLETMTCPTKAKYYKIDARTKVAEEAGKRFGKHLHSALALHSRLQEYGLGQEVISSRVSALLEQEFASQPIEENFRTLNWATTIYEQYAKKFAKEDFNVMAWKEPKFCKQCAGVGQRNLGNFQVQPCLWCNGTGRMSLMVEVTFVVKLFDYALSDKDWKIKGAMDEQKIYLANLPIYYHGIIDLVPIRNGLTFILDFKSTSRLGQSYWDDKRMIAQPKGYCFSLEKLLNIKAHGYIIRALRTNEPPDYIVENRPSKKGEFRKIEDWWNESLGEERFDLGEGELDEWRDNAIDLVEQFFWHYSRGVFPQNRTDCVSKYGRCQYYDVCSTFPSSQRDFILYSGNYKDKEQNQQLTSTLNT